MELAQFLDSKDEADAEDDDAEDGAEDDGAGGGAEDDDGGDDDDGAEGAGAAVVGAGGDAGDDEVDAAPEGGAYPPRVYNDLRKHAPHLTWADPEQRVAYVGQRFRRVSGGDNYSALKRILKHLTSLQFSVNTNVLLIFR